MASKTGQASADSLSLVVAEVNWRVGACVSRVSRSVAAGGTIPDFLLCVVRKAALLLGVQVYHRQALGRLFVVSRSRATLLPRDNRTKATPAVDVLYF
jgi:hypothetical protein